MRIVPEQRPIAGEGPGWISCNEMEEKLREWKRHINNPGMAFYWRGKPGRQAKLCFFHYVANMQSLEGTTRIRDVVFYATGSWDEVHYDPNNLYKIPENFAIVVKT